MFTLIVNGIAVFKLADISEIPDPQGKEAWQVVDSEGRTIAAYQPKKLRRAPAYTRPAPETAYDYLMDIAESSA